MSTEQAAPTEVPAFPVPLLLTVIVIAVSLSAIFIRLADAPGTVIALYRLVIASALTLPALPAALRRSRISARGIWLSVAAGVTLGWHFATWTTSLEFTSVAASVSLVTTTPLWIVLIIWLFRRRRPANRTLLGVLVAVAGGVIIGLDGQFGAGPGGNAAAFGNFLAVAGAVTVGVNMLLGAAAQRSGLSVMAYSGIAYVVAGLSLLPLPALLGQSYGPYPLTVFLWIGALAVVSQVIGHTAINYTLRFMDATLLSTFILLEPVAASLLAMLLFQEVPGLLTVLGALTLLTGVLLVNTGMAVRQSGGRKKGKIVL